VSKPLALSGKPGGDAKRYQEKAVKLAVDESQKTNSVASCVINVAWSEKDRCLVGRCPGLFYGGCHRDDEKAIFAELCDLVEETIKVTPHERMENVAAVQAAIDNVNAGDTGRDAAEYVACFSLS